MIVSYILGLSVLAGLAAAWVAVQAAWGETFTEGAARSDVLAGRASCHGCGIATECSMTVEADTAEGERP